MGSDDGLTDPRALEAEALLAGTHLIDWSHAITIDANNPNVATMCGFETSYRGPGAGFRLVGQADESTCPRCEAKLARRPR